MPASNPSLRTPPTATEPEAPQSDGTGTLCKVCRTCLGRYPMEFRVCPRDATELEEVVDEEHDALIGSTVGGTFQIVRLIGEGGMARVYEARHVRLSARRFAVKVLHPMHAQQPQVIARFQREAEAASGIAHPNVVDVYDVSRTAQGMPYLVSEYLRGRDFADLLDDRGKIEAPAAVRIVRQVCRALGAAHAQGVVHRDVKPDNVFLVGDPEAPIAKVLDFGISKIDEGSGATLTQTGMIMGTPGYMPPEQARGARIDHRADVYGVGAMLYRALTGRLPFDSDDPGEALSMVLTQDPPRPRSLEPTIPETLELVIERAMAKDPDDRYGSMEELEEDLADFDPETRASLFLTASQAAIPTEPPRALASQPPSMRRTTMNEAAREARLARPALVVLSALAYLWTVGCLVDAVTAAVSVLSEGRPATSMEALVVLIVVVAASITPAVFWVRHLSSVWKNTVRSVALSKLLRRIALGALIPYALLSLLVRTTAELGAPEWSLALSAASLGTAAVVYGLSRRRRT